MIAEPLRDLAVPIDQLRMLEGNPRRGDVKAVARSLQRFGQRKPVVARADGTVIAGNHMLAAARELGWSELAVTRVDDDDATAKAYALADNRTSELGTFDPVDLAAFASDVYAIDPALLEAASYGDLDALLAAASGPVDPSAEWRGMPEFESRNLSSLFHVIIHFASDDDAEAFFKLIERPRQKSLWWPESDGHVGTDTMSAYVAVSDEPES